MKRISIYSLLCAMILGAGAAFTGCRADLADDITGELTAKKGYLTIGFNINGSALTRVGEDGDKNNNNENTIIERDLYFYASTDGDDVAAAYHFHYGTDTGDEISISFDDIPTFKADNSKSFKIIVVTNCGSELRNQNNLTINDLKKHTTKAQYEGAANSDHRAFRGVDAPQAFVMTNLTQVNGENIGTVNEEEGTVVKISLKRVAAKIRVVLAVEESVTDDEATWVPDTNNMRLFFSNGMRKARLDGDFSELELVEDLDNPENSDWFSISTTGSKGDESDYAYARSFSESTSEESSADGYTYKYYNVVPHYTYPTEWDTNDMLEKHQPTLTVVIPWKKQGSSETIFQPTYYSMPVNTKGSISSNTYYYLRTHIGMKGSSTPEVPMKVDVDCSVLDWGKAEDTEVELKPIRFLLLNQTSFSVPNETTITIPYMSTHECEIVDFKATMYKFSGESDDEAQLRLVFDDNTTYNGTSVSVKGRLYDYELDHTNQTLNFWHKFNDPVYDTTGTDNILETRTNTAGRRNYTEERTDGDGLYYYKKRINNGNNKIYTRVLVEITIRHINMPTDTPYQEKITMIFYPAIYVTTEAIDGTDSPRGYGWIFVNGYGYNNTGTGGLGEVINAQAAGARYLTTITATALSEDEAKLWILDDPRTTYINNELDPTSIKTDYANHTAVWTSNNGPYDGSQTGRHVNGRKNECRTIWKYYTGSGWAVNWTDENGTVQTWKAEDDNQPRSIKYYYPGSELAEKANVVAPKVTIASYHAFNSNQLTKEGARKRCASYQQYGYPAGRWRLPTKGEVEIFRYLEKKNIIKDPYGGTPFWCTQGSTDGSVNNDGTVDVNTGRSDSYDCYSRCVYDTWYWEQVDAAGRAYNQIPNNGEVEDASNRELWKYFTWGDRPKDNPMESQSDDAPTVENFIRKMNERR